MKALICWETLDGLKGWEENHHSRSQPRLTRAIWPKMDTGDYSNNLFCDNTGVVKYRNYEYKTSYLTGPDTRVLVYQEIGQ